MIDRIDRFRRCLEEAVAERRVPLPFGVGLFCDSLPDVYDTNYVRVDAPVDPATLAAATETAMAGFFHHKVVVEPTLAPHAVTPIVAELTRRGYESSTHLVMARRREPDRLVSTAAVHEVDYDRIEPLRTAMIIAEPWGTPELAAELNAARRRVADAVALRFFGIFAAGGPVGYCELREAGDVSQVEDVNVAAAARGQGHGRALVQAVAAEAGRDGRLVFLEALAHDWPHRLYRSLGFDTVAERRLLLRRPHALTRLRLRTPRLELRAATTDELRALAAVAAGGVHPPEEMPFAVPWTDTAHEPGFTESFVGFHRDALAAWRPDDWRLHLVAFHDGRPVGVQSLAATSFAHRHAVTTGSWLGRAHQGRGLGTEMRAAVLAFAFGTLGAEVARSGAIAGNSASLGVARHLGYRQTGLSTIAPRGRPVPHHDLELARSAFRCPIAVEITGADGLGPLFGSPPSA